MPLMTMASTTRFYRIIPEAEPKLDDFKSFAVLAPRKPKPSDPKEREMWEGISTYDSLERARRVARKRPALGAFIALIVPRDESIRWERTGHRPGHYTLWGDPGAFLRCVAEVVPVDPPLQ